MPGKKTLIIFDCDGVLIDTEKRAYEIDAKELNAIGISITPTILGSRFGGISFSKEHKILEQETGVSLPSGFSGRVHDITVAALNETGTDIAMPGIGDTLDLLHGYAKCVASGSSPAWLNSLLTQAGLWGYFEPHIYSAAQVSRGKPAPDLFLFAANQMGISSEQCIVIEDSINGVQAAKAAGMDVLGFCGGCHCPPNHDARLHAEGAKTIFHHMNQLPDILASDQFR